MYQGEDITEHNNQRKLNILKGFVEVTDIIEKGHMDFSGGKAPAGGKGNLVQKKITDKSGHNTTRWVKNGQEETGQDESNVEAEQTTEGVKTSDDHAKETQSEDLKTYIANNPDGEHVAAAQAELQARGESDDMGTQGGEQESGGSGEAVKNAIVAYGNFSENEEGIYSAISAFENEESQENYDALVNTLRESNAYEPGDEVDEALQSANPSNGEQGNGEQGSGEQSQDVYQTPSQESLDSYYAMDEQGQRSVIEASMKHNIPFGAALSMVMESGQGSNTEAHGALDAAQQALDAAKTATGHPGAGGGDSGNGGDMNSGNSTDGESSSQLEAIFDLQGQYLEGDNMSEEEYASKAKEIFPNSQDFISAYVGQHNGAGIGGSSEQSALTSDEASEDLEYMVSTIYGESINGAEFIPDEDDEDEDDGDEDRDDDEDYGGGDSNFHNQDEEENEDQGGGDSNFHEQGEDKNSDNSKGFGGGDTESEDDGSEKKQDDKEKKKPNFGKK